MYDKWINYNEHTYNKWNTFHKKSKGMYMEKLLKKKKDFSRLDKQKD